MAFLIQLSFLAILILQPVTPYVLAEPQSAPQIGVSGSLSASKARRGGTVRASVDMDIPSGYHVNSNRPLERFLIPTQLSVDAPKGIRVGAVSYPRASLHKFKFSKNRVAVFEGRPTMRFNIMVPRNLAPGSAEIKVRVRYQSCNDDVCFPPQTRELSLGLRIE